MKKTSLFVFASVCSLILVSSRVAGQTCAGFCVAYAMTPFDSGPNFHNYFYQTFPEGASLNSYGSPFLLLENGDLKLIVGSAANPPIWHSNTAGSGAVVARMQEDGNFVLYKHPTELKDPVWATKTSGKPGSWLRIENNPAYNQSSDGVGAPKYRVSVYTPSAIWSSKTSNKNNDSRARILSTNSYINVGSSFDSPSGSYSLVLQGDGDLVLFNKPNGTVRWRSNTAGKGGVKLLMQPDGNLVIYKADGATSVWASNTSNNVGARLALQNDGNLVLYKQVISWTSYSATQPNNMTYKGSFSFNGLCIGQSAIPYPCQIAY